MIDLEQRNLPCEVESDTGEVVAIKTSFRDWLRFARLLSTYRLIDYSVVLGVKDETGSTKPVMPLGEIAEGLREFCLSPMNIPKKSAENKQVMDYLEDSDYIVGAFQQAYGIDLTSEDMHWHRFLALMRSLPSGTKYSEIIGYRSYDESKARKKPDEARKLLRETWALPNKDEATLAWQQEVFGGITPEGVTHGE